MVVFYNVSELPEGHRIWSCNSTPYTWDNGLQRDGPDLPLRRTSPTFSPEAKKEARTSPPLEAEWGLEAGDAAAQGGSTLTPRIRSSRGLAHHAAPSKEGSIG